MAGNGRLHILSAAVEGISEITNVDTQEALFDVAWSECNEHHIVGVCGDGAVLLWDLRASDGRPVARWSDHTQEAVCVAWALCSRLSFATASWDGTVRIYDPVQPKGAAAVILAGHSGAVNAVEWHPIHSNTLASGGAGAEVIVWDTRQGGTGASARLRFNGAAGDVLTLDWNRYLEHELITGGADGVVRAWDIRRTRSPVHMMVSHMLPVRRVRCSPHSSALVASASYDFSVCLWDIGDAGALQGALMQRASHHREFASGVDFSLFAPGLVASCAWDKAVVTWRPEVGAPPSLPASR